MPIIHTPYHFIIVGKLPLILFLSLCHWKGKHRHKRLAHNHYKDLPRQQTTNWY